MPWKKETRVSQAPPTPMGCIVMSSTLDIQESYHDHRRLPRRASHPPEDSSGSKSPIRIIPRHIIYTPNFRTPVSIPAVSLTHQNKREGRSHQSSRKSMPQYTYHHITMLCACGTGPYIARRTHPLPPTYPPLAQQLGLLEMLQPSCGRCFCNRLSCRRVVYSEAALRLA